MRDREILNAHTSRKNERECRWLVLLGDSLLSVRLFCTVTPIRCYARPVYQDRSLLSRWAFVRRRRSPRLTRIGRPGDV